MCETDEETSNELFLAAWLVSKSVMDQLVSRAAVGLDNRRSEFAGIERYFSENFCIWRTYSFANLSYFLFLRADRLCWLILAILKRDEDAIDDSS